MPTSDVTVALQLRVAELEREVAALRKQLHPAPAPAAHPDHAQRDQSARQRYEHWKQAYGNLFADAAGPDEAEEPVCSSSGSSTPEGTVRQRSTDGDDSDISSCRASTFSLSPAVQQPEGQWGSEHGHVTAAALGGSSPASPMATLSMQAAVAVTLLPMQQATSPGMWHAAADAAVAGASGSVDVGGSKRRSGHLHPASPPLGHAHASGPAMLGLSRQATRPSPNKRNRRYSGSDAHARSTSTSSITSGGPLPWSRAPVAAASTVQPRHLDKPRCSTQPVGSSQATDIHPDGPDVAASSSSWLQSTPARHQQHAPSQLLLVSLPTPSLMAGSMPSPLPAPSDYLGTSSSDDESEDEQGDSPGELRQSSGVCRPQFGSQADSLDALPRALQELACMNGWRVRQDQDAECSAAAGGHGSGMQLLLCQQSQ